MPGDLPDPAPGDSALSAAAAEEARDHLAAELRAARSAAIRAGADPGAVTADLQERLRRVRDLLAAREEETPPGGG